MEPQAADENGGWRRGTAGVHFHGSPRATAALASNELAAPEKTGVTLYQINGFNGTVPMKVENVFIPDGAYTKLKFASSNMNTQMQFMAKAVAPPGTIFKSFEVSTVNGNQQVAPASADYFDGKKIIDKVTLSPWQLNNLWKQCREQLTIPDGTYKELRQLLTRAPPQLTKSSATESLMSRGRALFSWDVYDQPRRPAETSRVQQLHRQSSIRSLQMEIAGDRREDAGRDRSRHLRGDLSL